MPFESNVRSHRIPLLILDSTSLVRSDYHPFPFESLKAEERISELLRTTGLELWLDDAFTLSLKHWKLFYQLYFSKHLRDFCTQYAVGQRIFANLRCY